MPDCKVSFALALGLAMLAPAQTGSAGPFRFERVVVDPAGPEDIWLKAIGDLNGDGRADLVAGGAKAGGLVWYENPSWRKHVIAAEGSFSTDGEVADVDRDGDQDVVAVLRKHIVWYENPGWQAHVVDEIDVHDIEVADLDKDGRLDIAARNQGAFSAKGDALYLYRQESPLKWSRRSIPIPNGEGLVLADLDRDGDPDAVLNGSWLENRGGSWDADWPRHEYGGAFQYPHTFVAVADINGDKRLDIVLSPAERAGSAYRISWFEAPSKAVRPWKEHVIEDTVEAVHHFAGAADFDGDRRADVVTARMHQGKQPEITLYRNEGGGRKWTRQVLSATPSHSMRIGDIDGDGRMDIYGANWRNQPAELWMNRTGRAKR